MSDTGGGRGEVRPPRWSVVASAAEIWFLAEVALLLAFIPSSAWWVARAAFGLLGIALVAPLFVSSLRISAAGVRRRRFLPVVSNAVALDLIADVTTVDELGWPGRGRPGTSLQLVDGRSVPLWETSSFRRSRAIAWTEYVRFAMKQQGWTPQQLAPSIDPEG